MGNTDKSLAFDGLQISPIWNDSSRSHLRSNNFPDLRLLLKTETASCISQHKTSFFVLWYFTWTELSHVTKNPNKIIISPDTWIPKRERYGSHHKAKRLACLYKASQQQELEIILLTPTLNARGHRKSWFLSSVLL